MVRTQQSGGPFARIIRLSLIFTFRALGVESPPPWKEPWSVTLRKCKKVDKFALGFATVCNASPAEPDHFKAYQEMFLSVDDYDDSNDACEDNVEGVTHETHGLEPLVAASSEQFKRLE